MRKSNRKHKNCLTVTTHQPLSLRKSETKGIFRAPTYVHVHFADYSKRFSRLILPESRQKLNIVCLFT